MKVSIVDPAGNVWPLDGSEGVRALRGGDGMLAAPYRLDSSPAVGRQGTVLERVRVEERDVELPVMIGPVDGQVRDVARQLMSWTNPRHGDGRLRIEWDDGQQRDLVGRVAEVVATGSDDYSRFRLATLVWRAFDPYWRADEIVREYAVTAPDFFSDPDGFPLQLASATITALVSEDNDGDADGWPVWTVRGPGTPSLVNDTTGESITFDGLTLDGGETLTVDTSPGVKTVEVDGDSVYDQLTLDSALFGLRPGVNVLSIDLDGGTEDSLVVLRYRPRRLAP